MVVFLVHGVHVAIVGIGMIVVAALLWPARDAKSSRRPPERNERIAELRRSSANGTLVEAAQARAAAEFRVRTPHPRTPQPPMLVVASVATLLAAGLHAAVSPEHFTEGLRFGVFFTVLSVVQVGTAIALLRGPAARLLALTVAVDLVIIVLWVATRTVGLPFGLADVETVGLPDSVCSAAEAVAALCCVVVLSQRRRRASTDGVARPPARTVARTR